MHAAMAVCTAFETPLLFPAPNFLATMTFVAEESPTKTPIIRLIAEPVEPTAASASLPANFPTTTVSAAL